MDGVGGPVKSPSSAPRMGALSTKDSFERSRSRPRIESRGRLNAVRHHPEDMSEGGPAHERNQKSTSAWIATSVMMLVFPDPPGWQTTTGAEALH